MSRFVGVSKLITTATRNKTCLLSNQKLATCYVGFSSKRLSSTNQVPTELAPTEVANKVTEVVDPPFVELGLADGWMPYSFVESLFETLHTYTGLPWWATIAIGTLTMRAVTFPIFVNSRKYATRMSNHGAKTSVSLLLILCTNFFFITKQFHSGLSYIVNLIKLVLCISKLYMLKFNINLV